MHRRSMPFHLSTVTDGDNGGGDDITAGAAGDNSGGDEKTVSLKTMQERVGRERANAERQQRELREQLTELQKASDELAKLKNADKTEQQRLADELAAVRKQSAEQDAENVQLRLAVDHGIGSEDRGLIGVGNKATVTARAERVGALLAAEKELAELKEAAKHPGGSVVIGRPVQAGQISGRPGATGADVSGGPSARTRGEQMAKTLWGSGSTGGKQG